MKPIATIRNKNIAFVFWEQGKFKSYSITKGFQDKDAVWHNQKIDMSPGEFKRLLALLLEADKKMRGDRL
jgi:hypothetical protein